MDLLAPGASVPRVHGKAVAQSPVLLTNVRPLGVAPFTITADAAAGPVFATTIV